MERTCKHCGKVDEINHIVMYSDDDCLYYLLCGKCRKAFYNGDYSVIVSLCNTGFYKGFRKNSNEYQVHRLDKKTGKTTYRYIFREKALDYDDDVCEVKK